MTERTWILYHQNQSQSQSHITRPTRRFRAMECVRHLGLPSHPKEFREWSQILCQLRDKNICKIWHCECMWAKAPVPWELPLATPVLGRGVDRYEVIALRARVQCIVVNPANIFVSLFLLCKNHDIPASKRDSWTKADKSSLLHICSSYKQYHVLSSGGRKKEKERREKKRKKMKPNKKRRKKGKRKRKEKRTCSLPTSLTHTRTRARTHTHTHARTRMHTHKTKLETVCKYIPLIQFADSPKIKETHVLNKQC